MIELDFWLITDVIIRVGSVVGILVAIYLCIRLLGLIRTLNNISQSVLHKTQLVDQLMNIPFLLINKRLEEPGSSSQEE